MPHPSIHSSLFPSTDGELCFSLSPARTERVLSFCGSSSDTSRVSVSLQKQPASGSPTSFLWHRCHWSIPSLFHGQQTAQSLLCVERGFDSKGLRRNPAPVAPLPPSLPRCCSVLEGGEQAITNCCLRCCRRSYSKKKTTPPIVVVFVAASQFSRSLVDGFCCQGVGCRIARDSGQLGRLRKNEGVCRQHGLSGT